MRIIVTGGLGFIGSNFVNYINENYDYEMLIVDKITYAANPNNILKSTPFLNKDICDVTPEELGEYDYIVHFAAETHVDNSIKDGRPFIRTNVEGTYNLLECARQNKNLKKFVHISTDEVYGDMDSDINDIEKSSNESCELNPSSYYSSTKASSDLLVMSCNKTYGLPYLITRTCNNFGENQHPEKFLPKVFNSIKNNIEVPIYGDGKQLREWIYVKDNVKIIYDLMIDETIVNDIYNIGSSIRYRNIELIELISKILDKEVRYKFVEDRLGHDKAYRLMTNKLSEYYKNKDEFPLLYHISDYLEKLYNESDK